MKQDNCKKCGAPAVAKRLCKWNNNGTWTLGGVRSLWFEVENIIFIFKRLENLIGTSLEKIITEASSVCGRKQMTQEFGNLKGQIVRIIGPLLGFFPKKLISKFYAEYMKEFPFVGFGFMEIEEFKWREKEVIILKNLPFLLFCGLIKGGLAGLWQVPTSMKISQNKEVVRLTIERTKEYSKIESYLTPIDLPILLGDIRYKTCLNCKFPELLLQIFEWDFSNGFVLNKENKKRWVGLTYFFPIIFTALEQELIRDISTIVAEEEKKYIVKNFFFPNILKTKNPFSKLLDQKLWGVLGWGNPSQVKWEDRILRVRVDNPFYEPILAGIIGGIYEIIKKTEVNVSWTPNIDGYTKITVSPKN